MHVPLPIETLVSTTTINLRVRVRVRFMVRVSGRTRVRVRVRVSGFHLDDRPETRAFDPPTLNGSALNAADAADGFLVELIRGISWTKRCKNRDKSSEDAVTSSCMIYGSVGTLGRIAV